MSEPLALVSVLAGIASLSGSLLSSKVSVGDGVALLRARWTRKVKRLEPYGLPGAAYIFLAPITDTLTTMDRNVLRASNQTVMDYRARRMASCSMTGVAAALVAQLTKSSLQQPYTSNIHWTVTALWTSGLVLSLLAVYYSFLLHQWIAAFSTAGELRYAFTHRTFSGSGDRSSAEGRRGQRGHEEAGMIPSLTVAARLALPPYLLSMAIALYVLTLGLYWGLAWKTQDAAEGGQAWSRNIFICYIITAIAAILLFTVPSAIGRILEDLDSLHLYREELGHVCRPRGDNSTELERGPDPGSEREREKKTLEDSSGDGGNDNNNTAPEPMRRYITPASGAAVTENEPLRGVGAVVAALLAAAEAQREAGAASRGVAAELERLVDGLVWRGGGRE